MWCALEDTVRVLPQRQVPAGAGEATPGKLGA